MNVGCPKHPDAGLLGIEQATRAVRCQLIINEDGSVEMEIDPMSPFVHEMETSTMSGYKCAKEDCEFFLIPEQIQMRADEILYEQRSRKPPEIESMPLYEERREGDAEKFAARYPCADERSAPEEFDVDQHHGPIQGPRQAVIRPEKIVQGKTETKESYHQRKAVATATAIEERKKYAEAHTASESPMDKVRRALGGES